MKTIYSGLLFLLLLSGIALSQNQAGPYRISRHDAWVAPTTAILAAGGWWSQSRVQPFTLSEVANLDVQSISTFDRFNAGDWRHGSASMSNLLAVAGCAAPLALFAGREERTDFWTLALLGTEVGLTTFGITNLTKGLAHRPRPFLYGSTAPLDEQLKADARLSFFSSHTSLVAAAAFFGAKVFNDYHHDSKARPWIWAAAAVVPAGVGFLRIHSGKHFLSDVVAGYALGAAVGYFVPRLHRNNVARNVSFAPTFWKGGSGVAMNWVF